MTTRPNPHRNLPLLACCANPRTTWWAGWVATASLLLASCGSSPPVPDWQLQTRQAADRATTAELTGHARVAEADWQRAQQQAARSALPEAVARVHLVRCAARRASLDWSPCEGLEALLPDAGAPLQAYARYLAGQPQARDAELLPLAQQPVARYVAQHRATSPIPSPSPLSPLSPVPPLPPPPRLTAETVADPLSRLVAASALVRAGQGSPEVVAMAVDTASAQGWTRPLLAWLGWSAQRAEAAGQTTEAQRLRRRMALLAPPSAPVTAPAPAPAPVPAPEPVPTPTPAPTSANREPR